MKKLIYLTTLCLLAFNANAQILKKQWIAGGGIVGRYSSNLSPSSLYKTEAYELTSPVSIGYFIKNKWALGLRTSYQFTRESGTYPPYYISPNPVPVSYSERTQQFSAGPFTRYYFLSPQKAINLYAEVGYEYGGYFSTNMGLGEQKGDVRQAYINIAPVYFINNHIAIELIASYTRRSADKANLVYSNTFAVGLGLQIHLNNSKQ